MATRGVYTEDEKKMMANFEKKADTMVGWAKILRRRAASEESMKNWALVVDCWNPLWIDDNYAANTRWGGIIAIPMYEESFVQGARLPEAPPSIGYISHIYIGDEWDLFKPVRVNDSFRVWHRRPQLVDETSLDGKGLRRFQFLDHDVDIINQRNEIVSTVKQYVEITVYPEYPKKAAESATDPGYIYTKKELAFIDRTINEEEIRGDKIRYWEDVSVGEKTRPVCPGPTTVQDMAVFTSGRGAGVPMREFRRRNPGALVVDTVTGVTHHDIEWHYSDSRAQAAGRPHAFHFGAFGRNLMVRCVTNWMGDDGFLRKFNWRHVAQTSIGDTLIGRGKVTNKRVANGEHLVDLAVSLENLRGNITETAMATVRLLSKEAPYIWK